MNRPASTSSSIDKRDLRRREREAEPANRLAAEGARSARLQRGTRIGRDELQHRREREQQRAQRRDAESRADCPDIQREIGRGHHVRRNRRTGRLKQTISDGQARKRRTAREQQRLDAEKPDQLPRRAPSDVRTAISPMREAPRANIRFARFAHAISRIVAVAANSTASGVRALLGALLCP